MSGFNHHQYYYYSQGMAQYSSSEMATSPISHSHSVMSPSSSVMDTDYQLPYSPTYSEEDLEVAENITVDTQTQFRGVINLKIEKTGVKVRADNPKLWADLPHTVKTEFQKAVMDTVKLQPNKNGITLPEEVAQAIRQHDMPVKRLRGIIPKLRMYCYMPEEEWQGKEKVKGMWEKRPKDWPDHIPHKDPNNSGKQKGTGEGKPKREELMLMFQFLKEKYIEMNPEKCPSQPVEETKAQLDISIPRTTTMESDLLGEQYKRIETKAHEAKITFQSIGNQLSELGIPGSSVESAFQKMKEKVHVLQQESSMTEELLDLLHGFESLLDKCKFGVVANEHDFATRFNKLIDGDHGRSFMVQCQPPISVYNVVHGEAMPQQAVMAVSQVQKRKLPEDNSSGHWLGHKKSKAAMCGIPTKSEDHTTLSETNLEDLGIKLHGPYNMHDIVHELMTSSGGTPVVQTKPEVRPEVTLTYDISKVKTEPFMDFNYDAAEEKQQQKNEEMMKMLEQSLQLDSKPVAPDLFPAIPAPIGNCGNRPMRGLQDMGTNQWVPDTLGQQVQVEQTAPAVVNIPNTTIIPDDNQVINLVTEMEEDRSVQNGSNEMTGSSHSLGQQMFATPGSDSRHLVPPDPAVSLEMVKRQLMELDDSMDVSMNQQLFEPQDNLPTMVEETNESMY